MNVLLLATHTGEAIYTAVGAVLVALIGIVGVWIQVRANGRRTLEQHEETRAEIGRVYEHVNNVETDVSATDGGEPMTLGRLVRRLDSKVDTLTERNTREHTIIMGKVNVHDVRIGALEREVSIPHEPEEGS